MGEIDAIDINVDKDKEKKDENQDEKILDELKIEGQ